VGVAIEWLREIYSRTAFTPEDPEYDHAHRAKDRRAESSNAHFAQDVATPLALAGENGLSSMVAV
jgi:hypothetical protein